MKEIKDFSILDLLTDIKKADPSLLQDVIDKKIDPFVPTSAEGERLFWALRNFILETIAEKRKETVQ